MGIGEFCNRKVVHAGRGMSVREAAQLMRESHVGSVVVVEQKNGRQAPIGIVTDRDIAVAVVALGLDPAIIQIGDLMAPRFASVSQDWGLAEVIEVMQLKGVRRMVVTDADGGLFGIVSADDIVSALAEELTAIARIAPAGREHEARIRQAAG